jgi:hypothetical protein
MVEGVRDPVRSSRTAATRAATTVGVTVEEKLEYQAPSVEELGTVAELTLMPPKIVGNSDGFTFMGQPICQPGVNCS